MRCRASARRALCLGTRSECALRFDLNVHITGAVPAQDVRLHTPETLLRVDLISVASTRLHGRGVHGSEIAISFACGLRVC